MAQTNDLSTFGRTLAATNCFGASQTNPNDMRNNCVSVSIARMEHFATVDELWQHTHGYPLKDKPLPLGGMLDLLARLGFNYQYAEYNSTATETAHQQFLAEDLGCSQLGDELMLLGYMRRDGSGHCINYIKCAPGWKLPVERYYFDFQHSNDGGRSSDNASGFKDAVQIVVLYHGAFYGSRSGVARTHQQEFDQYMAGRGQRKRALFAAKRLPGIFTDL